MCLICDNNKTLNTEKKTLILNCWEMRYEASASDLGVKAGLFDENISSEPSSSNNEANTMPEECSEKEQTAKQHSTMPFCKLEPGCAVSVLFQKDVLKPGKIQVLEG